ncbi:hypothetical protein [Pseudoalteromonas xiamenensis]
MKHRLLLASGCLLALSGCDVFQTANNKLEQQYLDQHPELQAAISTIRENGLNAVAKTAEKGSVASCVATKLESDPLGSLATVEGALQDSANLTDLFSAIAELSSQEISLDQIPNLLRQGAETLNYLRTLLSQYELAELKTKVTDFVDHTQIQSADVGSHLRNLIAQCEGLHTTQILK